MVTNRCQTHYITINYYWNRASAACRIQLRMGTRKKKFGVLALRRKGVGPRGVPGMSMAALELEAEAWQTERGKLRRKVTYGHKQMLKALYNNQLLLELGKCSV